MISYKLFFSERSLALFASTQVRQILRITVGILTIRNLLSTLTTCCLACKSL